MLYDSLVKLGASSKMERIGYRFPFAMIGVKGSKEGSANLAMDKVSLVESLVEGREMRAGGMRRGERRGKLRGVEGNGVECSAVEWKLITANYMFNQSTPPVPHPLPLFLPPLSPP